MAISEISTFLFTVYLLVIISTWQLLLERQCVLVLSGDNCYPTIIGSKAVNI